MCSFLLSSWVLQNLAWLNYFMQRRGPDVTTHVRRKGFSFVHNLLHMTGDRVLQPLQYRGGEIQILFNGEIYNYREVEERYKPRAGGGVEQKQADHDSAAVPTNYGLLEIGGEVGAEDHSSSGAGAKERLAQLRALGPDHFLPEKAASEELEGKHKMERMAEEATSTTTTGSSSSSSDSTAEQVGTTGASFASDTHAIYPAYLEFGEKFAQLLDGEYAIAIVDYRKNRLFLATDVFGTKPLWYSFDRGLHVATYESALERLGVGDRQQVPPNSILEIDLTTKFLMRTSSVYEFDLRQYKTSTDDWIDAFVRAVSRRIQYQRHGVFLGLSSGYDSGAINLALRKLKKLHFAYTIFAGENIDVVGRRLQATADLAEGNVVVFTEEALTNEIAFLVNHTEPFDYKARDGQPVAVSGDFASSGLSWICRETRKRGILIYLSGSGADEYISDYGFAGEKIYPHSNFGGLFPRDLTGIFPWHSLFLGTQRDYLMKEELIAGTHGVEGRYPFLDKEVVQEYLWLSEEVKNSKYKRVLVDFFEQEEYPFVTGKTGFNPHWNLKPEGEVEVQRVFEKETMREDAHYREGASGRSGEPASPEGRSKGRAGPAEQNGATTAGAATASAVALQEEVKRKLTEAEFEFVLGTDFPAADELVTQRACRAKFAVNVNQFTCCKPADAQFDLQNQVVSTSPTTPQQAPAVEQGDPLFFQAENAFCYPDKLDQEIKRMEEARQELAFMWDEVTRVQKQIEVEKEKMERMREWLNEQSVLVRQGSMHLVMMRMTKLEAVADRVGRSPRLTLSETTSGGNDGKNGDASIAGEHTTSVDVRPPIGSGYQHPASVVPVSDDVQIVTCVTGEGIVSDFPVFKIFVATMFKQGIGVVNVCEGVTWTKMAARLERYRDYLQERVTEVAGGAGTLPSEVEDDRLFWVSDGMDVFFNDMSSVLPLEGVKTVSELIVKRFKKFTGKKIVVSSERLCGWGGAHLCTAEDEGNFPQSPTTSKYLNAGGYIGRARDLVEMVGTVMQYAHECQDEQKRHTRECGSGEGSPDQYLFMKYFWANKATVALDVWQTIFGNFIEVENLACQDGWVPRCAYSPCCTRSDRIENFSPVSHGLYTTRGCAVYRQKEEPMEGVSVSAADNIVEAPDLFLRRELQEKWVRGDKIQIDDHHAPARLSGSEVDRAQLYGRQHPDHEIQLQKPFAGESEEYEKPWHLPISWHGNGCGKWIFIMALDALSRECPIVSQLTTVLVRDQATNDQEVLSRIEAGQKRRWNDPR